MDGEHGEPVRKAAALLTDASALFIGAGAGMGRELGVAGFSRDGGILAGLPGDSKAGSPL